MSSNKFTTLINSESHQLFKNSFNSKFDEILFNFLKEQDNVPSDPAPIGDDTALPDEDASTEMSLIQLAGSALFVDLDDVIEKHPEARDLEFHLNKLRPISISDAPKAFEIIQQILNLANVPSINIPKFQEMNFAEKNVLINTVVDSLFFSKNKAIETDSSIKSLIENISSDLQSLNGLMGKDPIASVELCKKMKKNIDSVLSTVNLAV